LRGFETGSKEFSNLKFSRKNAPKGAFLPFSNPQNFASWKKRRKGG